MRFDILTALFAGVVSLTAATSSIKSDLLGQSLKSRLTTLPLEDRDLPIGTCNSGTPCANGACCTKTNLCGYSKDFYGSGCHYNDNSKSPESKPPSNLVRLGDAKAQCGPYAAEGQQKCPLHICCSEFGYCGSNKKFCVWKNKDDPLYITCDDKYGGCGDVKRPSCGGGSRVSKRIIGYYESWANPDSPKC